MIQLPEINYSKAVNFIVNSIQNEMNRNGHSKAVLGLSGGIDSAFVATLASLALGKENVTGILMPYKSSSRESVEDAMKMVHHLGINHEHIEITSAVDAIAANNMVNPEISRHIRLGNIMARVRMITLFDYSSAKKAIVFGTGNKSEIELGYFTLFGDSASAINPVGYLYKTDVFKISKYLGIPESLITKAPSADLFEGQTDESEIGFSYADMDPVIYALTDLKMNPDEVIKAGHDEKLVMALNKRINAMSFKRNIPVILKYE
ncbi:MAG TPA: NAD+ synthase [bacterium]|jgi:NAD+ synthase|nr:NAD+ synthase [bacterium]